MKKFYIASSFKNIEMVRFVSQQLIKRGFLHTYDWTQNERVSTFNDLKAIGIQEKSAVLESDFLIVILPAGKGSHIELGIALGQGKKIYLYSPDDEINHFETTSTFYHLPEVEKCIGTIEELIEKVCKINPFVE
ncbi:group-specific protein [Bacillus timonensis]|uniref:Group-specific protein n=1 Tax=Bacillus timonensis TaxID=1033734 RepID=A0A4S3PTJ0_9BACI|nr:group-specific protein [Bacillus timonensis]THE13039.1 group-specific protein [Bacillus timonensis]